MANLQIVLASKNVEAQYVEMRVPLYSYGCENKVKKALAHLKGGMLFLDSAFQLACGSETFGHLCDPATLGIYSVNVDFNQQKVTVWGICNKYDVLATMKNKRKETRFWNPEDNQEMEDLKPTPTPPSPSSAPPPKFAVRSFSLTKARSLSWKAWKKVFIRSNSF